LSSCLSPTNVNSMSGQFADSEFWSQLELFSSTLLRRELDELRKQLREDICKDVSSCLQTSQDEGPLPLPRAIPKFDRAPSHPAFDRAPS